jgi:hypothetical protein
VSILGGPVGFESETVPRPASLGCSDVLSHLPEGALEGTVQFDAGWSARCTEPSEFILGRPRSI